jgi:dTDP-3-amino-3,4,6-trideoxy-alpha-D-glucose transaminase
MTDRVPFLSLKPAGVDADAVRAAIDRVVTRGWFILGPELDAFEEELAAACGTGHAVGVGCGTDAIALMLRALGIGRGDEVITSPLSAAFSALAIMMAGARPVFADIDPDRLTLSPEATEAAITPRTAAILPVHLYGQPADLAAFEAMARRHGLALVEDACQSHLATFDGRPVGTFGAGGALSFYPTKNLGALGDAGAVITNDGGLADRLRRLRNGGQAERYHHVEFGVNSRLDEIQAAILRARLPRLPGATARRRALANQYRRGLQIHTQRDSGGAPTLPSVIVPPELEPGHVYHLFPVRVPNDRAGFMAHLATRGIGTLIHYPIPLHRQEALAMRAQRACPVADRVTSEICSLPLNPDMSDADVDLVVAEVDAWSRLATGQ